jgi:hypothetical protein
MLRVRSLFQSSLVRIDRIDHPLDVPHVDPAEEVAEHYSIALPERGEFCISDRSCEWRVTPRDVLLATPGQVHSYTHDDRSTAPDDVCVVVFYMDESSDEVAAQMTLLGKCPTAIRLNNRRA